MFEGPEKAKSLPAYSVKSYSNPSVAGYQVKRNLLPIECLGSQCYG